MEPTADPVARFVAAVRSSADPGAASGPGTARLDELVALLGEAFDRRSVAADAIERLDGLAERIDPSFTGVVGGLFASGALRGNRENYGDPRNSYLAEVIARGLGLPITLSVVAMEVGRRLGVPIAGIGLPGHFMISEQTTDGSGNEIAVRFADPFNGGRIYSPDEIGDAWQTFTSSTGTLRPAMLVPVSHRAIVIRILNNLRYNFERQHDDLRLAILAALRAAFPELAAEAPERARWLRRMN